MQGLPTHSRARAINSSDLDAHILLGKCYTALAEFPQAISSYEAALSLKPDYIEARADLDRVYLEFGKSLYRQQRYRDALQALQQVSSKDHSLAAEVEFFNAETYRNLEDYEKAEAAYQEVVSSLEARDLVSAGEYEWLGTALYELGDYARFAEVLLRSAAFRPDPEDYSKLARAFDVLGQYQAALDAGSKALSLKPLDTRAAAAECRAHVGLDHTNEAFRSCQQVSQSDPGNAESLYYLALAWEHRGNMARARAQYRAAIARQDLNHPLDGYGHFIRANALYGLGEFRGAIEEYEKTVRLEPDFVSATFNLGAAYVAEGRTEDARKEYRILATKDPERAAKLLGAITSAH